MAKLNKTETQQTAKTLARRNPKVTSVTLEQLDAWTWKEQHEAAQALAREASFEWNAITSRYPEEFIPSYVEGVQNEWNAKTKARETARRNWTRATTGITGRQAEEMVQELLKSMNIRGARIDGGSVTVSRSGRSDDARLYFRFDRQWAAEGIVNPDNPAQKAGTYNFIVEISTSGSSYSPEEMSVLHKIHGELIDAANELKVFMSRQSVIWTYGIPDPADDIANSAAAVL